MVTCSLELGNHMKSDKPVSFIFWVRYGIPASGQSGLTPPCSGIQWICPVRGSHPGESVPCPSKQLPSLAAA